MNVFIRSYFETKLNQILDKGSCGPTFTGARTSQAENGTLQADRYRCILRAN